MVELFDGAPGHVVGRPGSANF